jgi:hypothetical protein
MSTTASASRVPSTWITGTRGCGGADGILGDEVVSGEPVALCSGGVAEAVVDGAGSRKFTELTAEGFRGDHDHHPVDLRRFSCAHF